MTGEKLKDETIRNITQGCISWANAEQLRQIEFSAVVALQNVDLSKEETALSTEFAMPNEWYLKQFLAIKMVKGLSHKSLALYKGTIEKLFLTIQKPVPEMTANDIRYFLAIRETRDGLCKVTLDSELRNLRSFFTALQVEEIIFRNPTAKIDKIKTPKKVKKPFTEMEMEQIRRGCTNRNGLNKKHLAIVETLYSTGCRVSELCGMNRDDIDGDRVLVHGKGNKERWVYLNPRAQIAMADYLGSRKDDFPSMFPGSTCCQKGNKPVSQRMGISSVESIIRQIGKRAGVEDCHPHRFRRTAATIALRRGMPIEQVGKMLGHEQLSTTQIYAKTEDEDVRTAHRKYLT